MDRFAMAVKTAKYTAGSAAQVEIGSPFDPTRMPNDATIDAAAISIASIPVKGARRRTDDLQGLVSEEDGFIEYVEATESTRSMGAYFKSFEIGPPRGLADS